MQHSGALNDESGSKTEQNQIENKIMKRNGNAERLNDIFVDLIFYFFLVGFRSVQALKRLNLNTVKLCGCIRLGLVAKCEKIAGEKRITKYVAWKEPT